MNKEERGGALLLAQMHLGTSPWGDFLSSTPRTFSVPGCIPSTPSHTTKPSHHTSTQVLRPNINNRVVHPFPLIHVRTSSAHLKDHFSLKWHYSNWHFDRRRCFSNILNGSLRNTSLWTIVICDFPCIWGKGAVKENKEVDEKL